MPHSWKSACCRVLVALPILASIAAQPLVAQQRVTLCVVDEAGRPVAQARALDVARRTLGYSDAAGRFSSIASTSATRVERIGYAPSSVLSADDSTRGCVVLRALQQSLPAIVVADVRSPALAQVITRETAARAPALGEPDIFRSLTLAGGVTQTNDMRAAVHLAGGATDETGVTLDGHPLQWPFHAASALSAFNVSALDRADVQIHHLGVAENDWLGGRIALVPRTVGSESVRALDVSLLSTTATLGMAVPGDATLLASGRLTYLGTVLKRITPGEDAIAPTYRDALVRLAKGDSAGWSVSILAYATHDEQSASTKARKPRRWGEYLAGLSTRYTGARWSVGARVSEDAATINDEGTDPALPGADAGTTAATQRIALMQRWFSASGLAEMSFGPSWSMSAGVTLDERRNDWNWNSLAARTLLAPNAPFVTVSDRHQTRSALFIESSHRLVHEAQLRAGLRMTRSNGTTYPTPRVTLEVPASADLRFAIAAERRVQFDAIPEEVREGQLLPPIALIDAPRRMEALSLSTVYQRERPTEFRWSVRGSAFARRYTDRTSVAGAPTNDDDAWPYSAMVRGSAAAEGLSVTGEAVRVGGLSLQGTYTLQSVREDFDGVTAPAAWDAPHNLNLFASLPLGAHWSASVVSQLRSGAAYTPIEARLLVPGISTSPSFSSRLLFGARNSTRLPSYQRVDLAVRRTWRRNRTQWVASAQVINVLNRENLLTYDWDLYFACGGDSACGRTFGDRSLPLVPSLALQVSW